MVIFSPPRFKKIPQGDFLFFTPKNVQVSTSFFFFNIWKKNHNLNKKKKKKIKKLKNKYLFKYSKNSQSSKYLEIYKLH